MTNQNVPAGEQQNTEPSALNLPNILTTLRIVLVPFFVWFLILDAEQRGPWRWWALAVFAVAMYTDKLDGDIARARGLITNFGKVADPIADKLLTGAALIMLSITNDLWWWVTIVILVREWGITLMRFMMLNRAVMPANKGGKLKTVLQTVGIAILLLPISHDLSWLWWIGTIIMLIAMAITVVTGIDYVRQAIKISKDQTDDHRPAN
ncbi:CDP-diacylglycerol--glycerol-3-phosphate 3-phosphatidyltransferase [Neomicrococcus lactis]|uniref:CDP-diacylglycerol--glycerol-3-phosphate 3-phosphatidyltransferase n=1 Tax=Neomicrococcus lactis TaxID=732241 RepID=A0A7W9DBM1_9MICC|nr:CDP-diacylglycerol--glycerol-3-phosphate 3-phosphatidyltransferase [Neomicrococcus lactis]